MVRLKDPVVKFHAELFVKTHTNRRVYSIKFSFCGKPGCLSQGRKVPAFKALRARETRVRMISEGFGGRAMFRRRLCRTRLADSHAASLRRHLRTDMPVPRNRGHLRDVYKVLASAVVHVAPRGTGPFQEGVGKVSERCGGERIREIFAILNGITWLIRSHSK